MATITPNAFSSYLLTDEEYLQGRILTFNQECVLQNERSQLAEQRLAQTLDPNDMVRSAYEEAFLQGKIDQISYTLEISAAAKLELIDLANPAYTDNN